MEMMSSSQTPYAMDIESSSTCRMMLPNEILSLIFQRLNKSNLKMARLVCKPWASMVNPILLDQVFVSPNNLQMEVFANIASHPIFSQTVRKLVYSTLKFDRLNRGDYGARLFSHIRGYLPHHPHWNEDKTWPQHLDCGIQKVLCYVHENRLSTAPSSPAVILRSELLRQGFFAYQRAYIQQDDAETNGEFLARLCLGLSKISKVTCLQFMCSWTSFPANRGCDCFPPCPNPCYSGSGPLARSWGRLFPRPTCQPSADRPTGYFEFDAALRAISLTGHKLDKIDIPTNFGVSQNFWDAESPYSRVIIDDKNIWFNTTSLRALTLRIKPYDHSEHANQIHRNGSDYIRLLPAWLYKMHCLRFLDLGLGHSTDMMDNDYREQLPMRSIEEVFLFDRSLSRLEILKLQGTRGTAAQFLTLFRLQPALRHIVLEYIELAEGSWETLFDQMHVSLNLQSLELRLELINADGSRLMDPDVWYENDVRQKIESYVLRGGSNPLRAKGSVPVST